MSNRKPTFGSALRMIDLILELDRRRHGWPVRDAAELLEVDPKTVKRYIEALADRLSTPDGRPAVEITYIDRRPHIRVNGPILTLDHGIYDYVSLFLASRFLDFVPADSGLTDGLEKAAQALVGAIAENAPGKRKVIDRFAQKFSVFHTGQQRVTNDEALSYLISALVLEKTVHVRYRGWNGTKELEPLTLMVYKEGLYLIARKGEGQPAFVLSVPLIEDVELGRPFTPPDDWDPARYRGERFGMFPGETTDVSLRCHPKLRNYLETRIWGEDQRVEETVEGDVRFHLRTTLSPEFVSWVCAFGPDVLVESPAELRDDVCARMRAALERYQAAGGLGA